MTDHEIAAELERLALAAGGEIMAVRAAGCTAESKADSSPVTEADRRAEAVILSGLAGAFPGIPVVAEEEIAAGRQPAVLDREFFLVDALDGTKEFIRGGDDFTVNIALVRDGVPVVGVVYAPARQTLWAGAPGQAWRLGCSQEHEPLERAAIRVREPGSCPAVVASRSHRTPETDEYLAGLPQAEIVSVGSSLKFCLLAAGEADLYPRFGRTMEWDTAAGDAVLRAAGGSVRCADGGPFLYGKRGQGHDADFANGWFIARGK